MNKFQYSVIALSLLFANHIALADELAVGGGQEQDSNMRKVSLDRSVVTASGYEQDIKDAPASISIIPQEEILTRPIRDIGDAVQDVPGVYAEKDKTGQSTVSMRGMSSAYTLILIDGKRQNLSRGFVANGLGNSTGFMPPPEMIERIEVLRGPASVIYGSDAMGGVINIITKKHFDKLSAGVQIEADLFEPHNKWGNAYGANAYVNTPLIENLLSLNLRGSYRFNEQNAFINPLGPTNNNPYTAHSSTGSQNGNAGFRLNFTPTARDYIYLDSELYYGRFGTLNTSSNSISAIREMYKNNTTLSHDGNYDWGKLSTFAQYSYSVQAPHAMNNGDIPIGAAKGDYVDWDKKTENNVGVVKSIYNNAFDFGNAGSLIFNGGAEYFYENLKGNNAGGRNMHQNQVGIFAEGEYLFSNMLSTTLGVRYNYTDRFSNGVANLNPRFYVNFNPTQWLTFKAGIANGMLTPTLAQSANEDLLASGRSGATMTYGNPDLEPELSWNYEFSTILDFEPAMLILTGYYTSFDNQIETVSGVANNDLIPEINKTCSAGNGGTCTYYHNIDRSRITGAEASLQTKRFYGFSLDANYGFTYTEALSGTQKGGPINSIPKHSFTIKPSYTYNNFSAYIRWSGKYKTPTPLVGSNNRSDVRSIVGNYYKNYQLVDIAATYKFAKHYALTLAINNIFNVHFIDYIGTQNGYQRLLPDRNYWISFKANL